MVGDTLSDAVHEINRYLSEMPDVYAGSIRTEIKTLVERMEAVRIKLDTPPGYLVRIGAAGQ
jgi:hypothetical protein